MKKLIFVLLLIVCIVLCTVTSYADFGSDIASLTDNGLLSKSTNFEKAIDRSIISTTSDQIELNDLSVIVTTDESISISYTYPSENVCCLTQDIDSQAYLYLLFYQSEAYEKLTEFIEAGMHLNIYDMQTGTDIYIYSGNSTLAEIVQNASILTEEDAYILQRAMEQNYFGGTSVTPGTIGSNLWFMADFGSFAYLVTFVNGIEIVCQFSYADGTPVTGLQLLDGLTISVS